MLLPLVQLHKSLCHWWLFCLAGVVAKMADVIAIRGCMGKCYSPVADVVATVY